MSTWRSESICPNRRACGASGRSRKSGLIKGYVAQIDQAKAGLPVDVFVNITLEHQDLTELKAFEEAVQKIPEVMECYLMTGEHDYVLTGCRCTDVNDYERIHQKYLTRLPGVDRMSIRVSRCAQCARPISYLLPAAYSPRYVLLTQAPCRPYVGTVPVNA